MNKRDFEKHLTEQIELYRPFLNLEGYTITFDYNPDLPQQEGGDYSFACTTRYPYREAHIEYTNKALENFEDNIDELNETILHELLHIVVAPFAHKAARRFTNEEELVEEEERLVEWLTNIMWDLL